VTVDKSELITDKIK